MDEIVIPLDPSRYASEFTPDVSGSKFIMTLCDYEQIFKTVNEHFPDQIVILTDLKISDTAFTEKLTDKILAKSSELSLIPSCGCGHWADKLHEGLVCPKCNTTVTSDLAVTQGMLPHKAWIECPKEIAGGFFHPVAYGLLTKWLRYKKVKPDGSLPRNNNIGNYLDLIIDPSTPIDVPEIAQLIGDKPRGFSLLYNEFDYIMGFFCNSFEKTASKPDAVMMKYLLSHYRNVLFTRRLPILSTALHAIIGDGSVTKQKRFTDKSCEYVSSAVSILSYAKFSPGKRKTQKYFETQTFKAYKQLIAYIEDSDLNKIGTKKGILRQQLYGCRLNMTYRAVIVPRLGYHEADELVLPWSLSVSLFKPHILNYLLRQYKTQDALRKYHDAVQSYDIEVHDIMKQLIRDYVKIFNKMAGDGYKVKGILTLFNRNPSIRESSILYLNIVDIKTNPNDHTAEISPMVCDGPNADFDGDQMNGALIVEMEAGVAFMRLHPRELNLSKSQPCVSDLINVTPTGDILFNTFLGNI